MGCFMNRIAAVSLVALIAACSQEGSVATAQSADDALAFFHLDTAETGRLAFGSVETRGAARVFSDVVLENDQGDEVRIETLRLVNPRMTETGGVFDAMEFVNLVSSGDEGAVSVGRLLIEDPNERLAALVSAALSEEGPDEDADWGEPTDYSFGSLVVENVNATGEDGGALTLDALRFNGFSGGVLEQFSLEGLGGAGESDTGEAASFALGSWVINGLDARGLDALAALDHADDMEVQRAIAESGFNDPFVKRFDDYAMADVRLDVDGVIVALERVDGEARQTRGGLETEARLRGLVVSFDEQRGAGAQAAEGLARLGYDRLVIDGDVVQRADEQGDRLVSDQYELRVEDAFTLSADYDVSGVAAYMKNAAKLGMTQNASFDPDDLAAAMGPLLINAFALEITDQSFVDRALAAAAAEQGSTPEAMRQQATALLAIGSLMAPPGPAQAFVGDAIAALSEFMENPGTLRIAVAPDQPVSVGALMEASGSGDPGPALALLNVTIEAE